MTEDSSDVPIAVEPSYEPVEPDCPWCGHPLKSGDAVTFSEEGVAVHANCPVVEEEA